MPTYRGGRGGGRKTHRIPSSTQLKAPGPLVVDAHAGVLINKSDAVRQNGYWVKRDWRFGSRDKDVK